MSAAVATAARVGEKDSIKLVIVGASLGTIFEWYDFFLYLTLAVFFSENFFPLGNPSAGLLASLGTFGAAFVVRPFGSLLFGHIGDRVGRKYSFLVTITLMGLATAGIGFVPTFATIGWAAPVVLVILRLIQGLSMGGEFSGAATYVAEHAPDERRGYLTSYVQMTVFIGTSLSLAVVLACRLLLSPGDFSAWGWRIPFVFSLLLLAISIYIRLKLSESPVFEEMKRQQKQSRAPIREAFSSLANIKAVVVTLVMCMGQVVVGYMSGFTYVFLLVFERVDPIKAAIIVIVANLLNLPVFTLGGWLSDRAGRKWILLSGCALAALTLFPIFHGLTYFANPQLAAFERNVQVIVASNDCHIHIFATPNTKFTECDHAREFLSSDAVTFQTVPGKPGEELVTTIGTAELKGFDRRRYLDALNAAGYPLHADASKMNLWMVVLLLFIIGSYAALTFGPLAAFLVEHFPTRIRYTSVSVAYNLGGMVGGLTPFFISALSVAFGDVYFGLWFPVLLSAGVFVFGAIMIQEHSHRRIREI